MEYLEDAEGIGAAATAALGGFHRLIEGLRAASTALPLPALVERVLADTGYRDHLRDGTPEGDERWSNVTELAGLAAEHAEVSRPRGSPDSSSRSRSSPTSTASTAPAPGSPSSPSTR